MGSKFGANEEERIYGGISSWKVIVLPSTYKFPLMPCSPMIVNGLLGSVSENVPHLLILCYKEVKHINIVMRMWNMMKCFISEVNRVDTEKVCWKSKMKDLDYISTINVWYNVHNDFNIKYMANKKQKTNLT